MGELVQTQRAIGLAASSDLNRPCGGTLMLSKFIDALFGCRHARYSFPITVRAGSRSSAANQRTGTYVACLDCGREFRYDWQEMKIVGGPARETAHALVTKQPA